MQGHGGYTAYVVPEYMRPDHHRTGSYPVYPAYPGYGTAPSHNGVPFPMPRPKNSRFVPPNRNPPPPSQVQDYNQHQPVQHLAVPRTQRQSSRANEAPVIPKPQKNQQPLKSAMKKRPVTPVDPPAGGVAGTDLTRSRTTSDPQRIRANSLTRPLSREASRRHFTSNVLLVSFHGHNKLRIDSLVLQVTLHEIREKVLPAWSPGVDSFTYSNERNELIVQFNGRPWTEKGTLGVMAVKMILLLWSVLGDELHTTKPDQVYTCEAMIHSVDGTEPPRIVFGLCNSYSLPGHHFAICFMEKRRKLKLIGTRGQLAQGLTDYIRQVFPQNLSLASWRSDDSYKIEMKSQGFDQISDLFLAEVLHYITNLGFKLDVGIPLPQQSFLGLSGRREIWIFTSVGPPL